MTTITDHDAYSAAAPEQFRELLQHLREVLRRALPDTEEIVAYSMPGFRLDGTIVAGYAAFTKQCGLYVAHAAIAEHAEAITAAGLRFTKTGVTFTLRRPIPDELIEQLARASLGAAEG